MRPHLVQLDRIGNRKYTQTGYHVRGYRVERIAGNRWSIAEASRSFESLHEALDWIEWKVRN